MWPVSIHKHMNMHTYIYTYMCNTCICSLYTDMCPCLAAYIHIYVCHTGVFSRTIKSLVHDLGTHSSMTKPTSNSTLYAFIEEVNFSHLQKMVLQFTICFVPIVLYTYMVYTLYNKIKHLVQSSNMHFTINQINSLASNNNRQLPGDECTVHQCILIEIRLCCVPENSVHPLIYLLRECMTSSMTSLLTSWRWSNERFSH